MNKEEAIVKAREAHGDRYGYDRLPEDVDYKTKYDIFCVKHQEYFSQNLKDHIYSKRGCRKCSQEALVQLRIQSAKSKFQEYVKTRTEGYIYDWDSYVDVKKPINIYCDQHGWFKQQPNVHSSGAGCRSCGMLRAASSHRIGQESFIEKANNVHNFKYDYTKSVYTLIKEFIIITCPKHRCDFKQRAADHLAGKTGCKLCASEASSERLVLRHQPSEAISILNKVHDNKYSYLITTPVRSRDYISIICPVHKEFTQRFDHHRAGSGCKQCAVLSKAENLAFTTEDYITRANQVHNDFYDYSKVVYKNSTSKVTIICPIHQEFKQNAASHLSGSGCPSCGFSGYDPKSAGVFYILKVTNDVIKFGITKDIDKRIRYINNDSSFNIEVLYSFSFSDGSIPQIIETTIKKDKNIKRKVVNKSDMLSGYTETTYLYNLPKILQIVENFTNALSQ